MPSQIKYYPEDERNGTLGIKLPANGRTGGSTGGFFNMSRTTEEQAVTNYINLLLTKPGERYMQPNFGIFIQGYLFEQNTDFLRTKIEAVIHQQAAFWLPYIRNHSIEVRAKANVPGLNADPENAIQIVITFSVLENSANHTIVIFQDGGKTSVQVD